VNRTRENMLQAREVQVCGHCNVNMYHSLYLIQPDSEVQVLGN
jgi:hypothetical protein